MNGKEHLNEEQYQKTKKKILTIGNFLLFIGALMMILGLVMSFGFHKLGFFAFTVVGLAFVGFGLQAKLLGKAREINAFLTQQQMPIAKESIEKMAPSVGKAAKEIAKGVKEGLKDEDK